MKPCPQSLAPAPHPRARHIWRTLFWFCMMAWIIVASPRTVRAGDDYRTRIGEPSTMTLTEAWQQDGLRLQLLGGYERAGALGLLPAADGVMFAMLPSLQLSPLWSADVLFRYAVLTSSTSGVHWVALAGASLHPVGGLSVSAAVGYTGTFLSDFGETAQPECSGGGGAFQARVSYMIPALEGFSTGPILQGEVGAIRCTDLDTGRQTFYWWPSASLAWGVAWR